jgi:hypothetical protein
MHLILATMLTLTQSTGRNVDSLIPGQTPFAAPAHTSAEPLYPGDPAYARCIRRHGVSGLCRHVLRRAG